MRKHISTIITAIIFLTGLSLLLYPTVSNFWNSKHQTQAVAEYSDRIEKMGVQEKKQALEQAAQYNQTLVSDAGRFTPSEEQDALYKSLLNADGTGMMGYITIPEIKCKLALYHTVDDSVLQVGIGHLEGSSLPVGGTGTHCVLSGHRGLPSAKLFTDLDKLQKGDVFLLHIMIRFLHMRLTRFVLWNREIMGRLRLKRIRICVPFLPVHHMESIHRDCWCVDRESRIVQVMIPGLLRMPQR